MARQPRFEYPGALYHVMARGNGGDDVFVTDDDRKSFLFRLGQVCASHGWKVHAWVIRADKTMVKTMRKLENMLIREQ